MSKTTEAQYDPSRIGYWARIHNLNWDVCSESIPDLQAHLDVPNAHTLFVSGWDEAEYELFQEDVAKLLDDLADGYPEPTAEPEPPESADQCPACGEDLCGLDECTNEECSECEWLEVSYKCPQCGAEWTEESGVACDSDCAECGCRHVTALSYRTLEEASEELPNMPTIMVFNSGVPSSVLTEKLKSYASLVLVQLDKAEAECWRVDKNVFGEDVVTMRPAEMSCLVLDHINRLNVKGPDVTFAELANGDQFIIPERNSRVFMKTAAARDDEPRAIIVSGFGAGEFEPIKYDDLVVPHPAPELASTPIPAAQRKGPPKRSARKR